MIPDAQGQLITDPVSDVVPTIDPAIEALILEASQQQLIAYVRQLESFGTRNAFSDTQSETFGIGAARRWIFNEFVRVGNGRLTVEFQDFPTVSYTHLDVYKRQVLYDETAPAGDESLQRVAAAFRGKRLPLIDEVHISVIEETQPRWLSFLNEEQDLTENVPADFAPVAIPNNQLAPNLAKRGIQMVRYPRADVAVSYFGMEHPVVGGYEPHKVALRRAIALAVDVDREIRLVRRGQAVPAQGPVAPSTWGHDPAFKSEMSTFRCV